MRRMFSGGIIVALVLLTVFAVQFTGTAAPQHDRSRAFEAWTQSLNQRADHQLERARAERANDAWSQRLSLLAQSHVARRGMSERAKQAWTDRLSAQAEDHGPAD